MKNTCFLVNGLSESAGFNCRTCRGMGSPNLRALFGAFAARALRSVLSLVALSALVAGPLQGQSAATAGFLVSPPALYAAQAAVFTDTSSGTPTSWAWSFGDGATSAVQHPVHLYAQSGRYTVTLKVESAAGSSQSSQTVTVGAAVSTGRAAFNMDLTLSDRGQSTTIGFSGLAIITGNLNAQSFFPPGKVSDYFGFQYLRDNDPDDMGHNTSFLTRAAYDVIYLLNDSQFAQLRSLAVTEGTQIDLYGYQRFPLMKAFRRQLEGAIPSGSTGLNLAAVKQASRELYLIDGEISYNRAALYASIISSLDAPQRAALDKMKGRGWKSWPDITSDQVKAKMASLPKDTSVAVMSYASDIYSWYAGSVEADVYFCPERHGTYYGGFYIKDAPAVGNEGYSIDEQITALAGSVLCDASKGYVSAANAAKINDLVEIQRQNLYSSPTENIVLVRTKISSLLRSLLDPAAPAAVIKSRVLELSATYGDLDGENNYQYATAFAQVYQTLTPAQLSDLTDIRKALMAGTYPNGTHYDFTVCTTPFLYSAVISDLSKLAPYVDNTDYLFFAPVVKVASTTTVTTTSTVSTATSSAAAESGGGGALSPGLFAALLATGLLRRWEERRKGVPAS